MMSEFEHVTIRKLTHWRHHVDGHVVAHHLRAHMVMAWTEWGGPLTGMIDEPDRSRGMRNRPDAAARSRTQHANVVGDLHQRRPPSV